MAFANGKYTVNSDLYQPDIMIRKNKSAYSAQET